MEAQAKGMYLSEALQKYKAAWQRVRSMDGEEFIVTVRPENKRSGWDVSIASPGQPPHYHRHLGSITAVRNIGKTLWSFTFRRREWYGAEGEGDGQIH